MIKKHKTFGSVLTVAILVCVTFASATTIQQQINNITTQNSINPYSVSLMLDSSIRQPAEFEPMQGVLIRYPFGISYQIIAEMAENVTVVTIASSVSQMNSVESQYQSQGVNVAHCRFLIAPTDTYWTRDYGPWFIFNGNNEQGVVDFTYNRPRPNDDAIPGVYANNQSLPLYVMPLRTTGGNYMTDGQGIAISTTLVWTENPGVSHAQINQTISDYLGIHTYHVVPDVNGDYIEHIDCWGKYLAPDKIMIRQVPPSDSQYTEIEAAVNYFSTQMSCYGTPYHVVRVYTPNDESYTNSLILNNKVFVPIMGGDQWDDDAVLSYQNAMPGYEVLGFTGTWESTDALHCRAMGITDPGMLYIEHIPLAGNQTSPTGYDIQAKIYPYSGEGLIAASTGVYWNVNGQAWNFLPMQPLGNDLYHAIIPMQTNGSIVSYYIHAEDGSGRHENHPYIGAANAHSFSAYGNIQPNTPPEKPQTPTGPAKGKVGTAYLYNTQTTDADGDAVFYLWDWGNGNISEWLGPYASGQTASVMHTWTEKGTYSVRVKAKDAHKAESNWSDPLPVTMPFDTSWHFMFFEHFTQWFPRLSLFLQTLYERRATP